MSSATITTSGSYLYRPTNIITRGRVQAFTDSIKKNLPQSSPNLKRKATTRTKRTKKLPIITKPSSKQKQKTTKIEDNALVESDSDQKTKVFIPTIRTRSSKLVQYPTTVESDDEDSEPRDIDAQDDYDHSGDKKEEKVKSEVALKKETNKLQEKKLRHCRIEAAGRKRRNEYYNVLNGLLQQVETIIGKKVPLYKIIGDERRKINYKGDKYTHEHILRKIYTIMILHEKWVVEQTKIKEKELKEKLEEIRLAEQDEQDEQEEQPLLHQEEIEDKYHLEQDQNMYYEQQSQDQQLIVNGNHHRDSFLDIPMDVEENTNNNDIFSIDGLLNLRSYCLNKSYQEESDDDYDSEIDSSFNDDDQPSPFEVQLLAGLF